MTPVKAVPTAQARTASARNGFRRFQQRIAAHRHGRIGSFSDVQSALATLRCHIEAGNYTPQVGDAVLLLEIQSEAANILPALMKLYR